MYSRMLYSHCKDLFAMSKGNISKIARRFAHAPSLAGDYRVMMRDMRISDVKYDSLNTSSLYIEQKYKLPYFTLRTVSSEMEDKLLYTNGKDVFNLKGELHNVSGDNYLVPVKLVKEDVLDNISVKSSLCYIGQELFSGEGHHRDVVGSKGIGIHDSDIFHIKSAVPYSQTIMHCNDLREFFINGWDNVFLECFSSFIMKAIMESGKYDVIVPDVMPLLFDKKDSKYNGNTTTMISVMSKDVRGGMEDILTSSNVIIPDRFVPYEMNVNLFYMMLLNFLTFNHDKSISRCGLHNYIMWTNESGLTKQASIDYAAEMMDYQYIYREKSMYNFCMKSLWRNAYVFHCLQYSPNIDKDAYYEAYRDALLVDVEEITLHSIIAMQGLFEVVFSSQENVAEFIKIMFYTISLRHRYIRSFCIRDSVEHIVEKELGGEEVISDDGMYSRSSDIDSDDEELVECYREMKHMLHRVHASNLKMRCEFFKDTIISLSDPSCTEYFLSGTTTALKGLRACNRSLSMAEEELIMQDAFAKQEEVEHLCPLSIESVLNQCTDQVYNPMNNINIEEGQGIIR